MILLYSNKNLSICVYSSLLIAFFCAYFYNEYFYSSCIHFLFSLIKMFLFEYVLHILLLTNGYVFKDCELEFGTPQSSQSKWHSVCYLLRTPEVVDYSTALWKQITYCFQVMVHRNSNASISIIFNASCFKTNKLWYLS